MLTQLNTKTKFRSYILIEYVQFKSNLIKNRKRQFHL